jgi:hypothetical protein
VCQSNLADADTAYKQCWGDLDTCVQRADGARAGDASGGTGGPTGRQRLLQQRAAATPAVCPASRAQPFRVPFLCVYVWPQDILRHTHSALLPILPSAGGADGLITCQEDLAAALEASSLCADDLQSCRDTGGMFVSQLAELREELTNLTGARSRGRGTAGQQGRHGWQGCQGCAVCAVQLLPRLEAVICQPHCAAPPYFSWPQTTR